MKFFEKIASIVNAERVSECLLGCPSNDQGELDRRMTRMALMTGGRGFRIDAIKSDGERGKKKRAARKLAAARVSEVRSPEYMNASAT